MFHHGCINREQIFLKTVASDIEILNSALDLLTQLVTNWDVDMTRLRLPFGCASYDSYVMKKQRRTYTVMIFPITHNF